MVGGLGEATLLVEQGEQPERPGQEHVQDGPVVDELDHVDADALGHVLLLLPGEDVLVEKVLDLLVGDVDAQLLEAVAREVLEAENVQKTHRQRLAAVKATESSDHGPTG